jgi:hypothetical protein
VHDDNRPWRSILGTAGIDSDEHARSHLRGRLPDRQVIMIGEGPAEIASWFFPHKSNEDEPLSTATEELLDERIADALDKSADDGGRK